MAYCPSLTDLNDLFAATKNQFDKQILAKFYMENPYATLFPRMEYDYSEGQIPQVITSTYELPTEFPIGTAMGSISLNSGTGNSCLVEPTVVKNGNTVRNYALQTKAFQTPVICLTDLQFSYQAAQQISNLQNGLTQYSTRFWTMWYQAQVIGLLDTKVSTLANCITDEVTSQDYDFDIVGLSLPTVEAEWCHLQPLYDRLARLGGEQYAVGMAGGMPAYSLNLGPGYKRKLFQADSLVRETVNWGDAFQNFTARGINTAIYGFIPNVDLFPVRYDGSLRYIPPFVNVDATTGRKYTLNPAYKTVANGGSAVYEVITVTARDVFEARVAPGSPSAFGKASFNPQNYAGEVQWINNPDMCNNQLGNLGFYRFDIRVAPKPLFPENGFAILTLAKD
jgi:hypothetical protein